MSDVRSFTPCSDCGEPAYNCFCAGFDTDNDVGYGGDNWDRDVAI